MAIKIGIIGDSWSDFRGLVEENDHWTRLVSDDLNFEIVCDHAKCGTTSIDSLEIQVDLALEENIDALFLTTGVNDLFTHRNVNSTVETIGKIIDEANSCGTKVVLGSYSQINWENVRFGMRDEFNILYEKTKELCKRKNAIFIDVWTDEKLYYSNHKDKYVDDIHLNEDGNLYYACAAIPVCKGIKKKPLLMRIKTFFKYLF